MSAKTSRAERKLKSLLQDENIVDPRSITPPCRTVVGKPVLNGLVVLPPDTANAHFNKELSSAARTTKRYGSADRIQRKLRSVPRRNSAGGRLVDERNLDHSRILEKSEKPVEVQKELRTAQSFIRKEDVGSASFVETISNGISEGVDDVGNSLHKLHVDEDLPIELQAEFLSCVMEKSYEKALRLCEDMLSINPENVMCVEFQNTIREKLLQEESSQEDSEADESGSETDDDESEKSEKTDSGDDAQGDDDESSEDEGGSSESSSDSDIELPSGPLNLLMGGLPLRPCSTQP